MGSPKMLSSPDLGWMALVLSTLTTLTIDQAFERLAPDPDADLVLLRRQENEDLVRLRPTATWAELGEIFNISGTAAFNRERRFKGLGSGFNG